MESSSAISDNRVMKIFFLFEKKQMSENDENGVVSGDTAEWYQAVAGPRLHSACCRHSYLFFSFFVATSDIRAPPYRFPSLALPASLTSIGSSVFTMAAAHILAALSSSTALRPPLRLRSPQHPPHIRFNCTGTAVFSLQPTQQHC